MKPFLRRTDRGRLAPVGWVAEPTGVWAGGEVEVVHDPRRHDVTFLRHRPTDTDRAGLRDSGYRRVAVDGDQEMWVRDRLEAARRSLERSDRRVGGPAAERVPGVGGPSL
ncbi:MAG: hypothetical protein U5R31_17040 [Acidimicrobiia bacterium]|nr:hypothetical protein [Acidimicrobiia bacterium]